jgi:hypothetical protein
MSVIYTIKIPGQDSPLEMSGHEIMAHLNEALAGTDKSVTAISPDGMTAQVMQGGKQYQLPMDRIIKKFGYSVESAMPPKEQTRFDTVHSGWRFATSNLEDDAQKRAYLETKVKDLSPQAQVVGSGRDWFAYDPAQAKWLALTNSPDWDLADLAEGGQAAASITGGVLGGIGGAAAGSAVAPGPGTVAGGMVGAAGGTAAAESLTRGAAAMFDPDYREAFDLSKAAQGVGTTSAIAGVAPLVGRGLAAAGSKILSPGIQQVAGRPISSAAQATGKVAEGVGTIARGAQIGQTNVGKTVGAVLTPGLSEASLLGAGTMVPKMGVQGANWVANKFGKGAAEESAEGILGRFGGWLGGKLGGRGAQSGQGINLNPASGGIAGDLARQKAAQEASAAGAQYGRSIGQGVDTMADAGGKIIHGAEELFGMGAGATAKTGAVLQSAGKRFQRGAQAAGQYEPAVIQQMLARGAGDPRALQTSVQPTNPYYNRYQPGIPVQQQMPQYQQIAAPAPLPQADLRAKYPGYLPYDLEM